MEGKAKFIFPVIISALIVFVVSGVVTFTNIGLRADFVPRWLKAFALPAGRSLPCSHFSRSHTFAVRPTRSFG